MNARQLPADGLPRISEDWQDISGWLCIEWLSPSHPSSSSSAPEMQRVPRITSMSVARQLHPNAPAILERPPWRHETFQPAEAPSEATVRLVRWRRNLHAEALGAVHQRSIALIILLNRFGLSQWHTPDGGSESSFEKECMRDQRVDIVWSCVRGWRCSVGGFQEYVLRKRVLVCDTCLGFYVGICLTTSEEAAMPWLGSTSPRCRWWHER